MVRERERGNTVPSGRSRSADERQRARGKEGEREIELVCVRERELVCVRERTRERVVERER